MREQFVILILDSQEKIGLVPGDIFEDPPFSEIADHFDVIALEQKLPAFFIFNPADVDLFETLSYNFV